MFDSEGRHESCELSRNELAAIVCDQLFWYSKPGKQLSQHRNCLMYWALRLPPAIWNVLPTSSPQLALQSLHESVARGNSATPKGGVRLSVCMTLLLAGCARLELLFRVSLDRWPPNMTACKCLHPNNAGVALVNLL